MTERLTAGDWTEAGLSVLARDGIDAVRVEPLARALGVTKGSFYWHFEDRQALLDGMLIRWEKAATLDVIDTVQSACNRADERLRELTRMAFLEGGTLDRAVRAWASHDEGAATVVSRVDAERYSYVQGLLEAHGLAPPVAAVRARLLYTSLVGEQHVSLKLSRKRRVEWALQNLESLLTRPQAPLV